MEPLSTIPEQPRPLAYEEARLLVHNGDVLLWRPTSLPGRLICRATREPYSHAALAGWDGERSARDAVLRQLDFCQWYGGRGVNLSGQVRRCPGACDVYRFPGEWQACHGVGRRQAVLRMSRRTGGDYGWRDFLRVGYRRVMRRLVGRDVFCGVDTTDGWTTARR